ncbi:methionine ABC transporter ATP-binding protein [endosymbiont 'TC1' of Trimyema compressum]|uniref:methionine ABC transporter ATP-binding protein n=1 Tax=endosymbiont 'TC1' of Trimyema compressum TaxID=243899 RepID=UPI0007F0527C|nr:methionine ABC transporter ATP-binding protein [endosymbiont 'TC1' of Trimyema compressum]AMP20600.1 methionine ABC transporter ATP-binding protein [endosymbiont 'TC1' of Trimyema compressum]
MIIVKDLIKSYGETTILKNISFEINKGEIFGIVGRSGAGKSTLLRCLNGLEHYQDGSIKVLGKEIKDLKEKDLNEFKKDMGMIFQNFNLMERKTVFDNIAFPMEIHKVKKDAIKERVTELLKLVELEDKRNQYISQLSGGQKQRVGIARALALNPQILLCDEATSALDPKTTTGVLDLLDKINKELGITIVIVTHQMEVIKNSCSRTLVLESGHIKGIDLTENLFLKKPHVLDSFFDENELLPKTGTNIKLLFNDDTSTRAIIARMARALDLDISIVWGELESFKDKVLGSLIINIESKFLEDVVTYLEEEKIQWEVLK